MTLFLVIAGWGLMYLFEMKNPQTIQYMSLKGKLLSSFFASVSPRTAGFYSINLPKMTLAGKVLTIILMFIGGSPGGTAGGVKTTTIGILMMTIVCVIKNREDTEIFQRTIGKNLVYKSFVIVTLAMGVVIIDTVILSFTETGASLEYILYEITSALGTVGLTLGLTPKLSVIGKLIICATMYIGRIGPLTLVMALSSKKDKNLIKYPDGKILVG